MTAKRSKRKKRVKQTRRIHSGNNQKITHSLDLLNSRALLSLANYLDTAVTDKAHTSMERLFRDYKKHKKEVHKALIGAFKFLVKERYVSDKDDPPYYKLPEGPPPSNALIKDTKKHINRIAKKVWKK